MIRLLLALLVVLLSAWPASAARMANGTADYLVSASAIDLSAYTKGVWAGWIYADSYNNVGKYYFNFAGVASGAFGLIADQASGVAEAFVVDGSGFSEFTFTRPSTGAWHHIVVNVDWTQAANNKVTAVWVDAASQTLTNTSASAGAGPFGNGTLRVASFDGTTSFLPGREAELAFWGGINFTQGDVNSLYNSGAGVVATAVQNASLKYYWQLCGIADSEPATTGGINLTVSDAGGGYGPIGITHPISGTGICTGGVPSINAASCSQNNFASAINLASNGDTVTIPAGTCTWPGHVETSKRLTIRGAGDGAGATRGCGSCTTTITDGTTSDNFFGHLLRWNLPTTGLSTMSGMNFVGNCLGGDHTNGMVAFFSDGIFKQFRLHHNSFYQCGTAAIKLYDIAGGVVDHNSFRSNFVTDYYFTPGWGGSGGSYGDNSYAQPSSLGTDNAMYFEDNDYFFPNFNAFVGSNDGWMGHRAVYRFNHYTNVIGANGHGTESAGRPRGFRHHEVYENDWTIQSNMIMDRLTGFRGGTGMMFNNRVTVDPGAFLGGIGNMAVDRAGASNHYEFWGRCGQYNVSLTSSGTTATATITNPNADGNGNGYNLTGAPPVYVQIINATDTRYNGVWQVVIPAPVGETFQFTTTTPNLTNGDTGVKQSPFDQNTDSTGYACFDQVGRGQSDQLGDTYTPTQTPPLHWPNQFREPVYIWNNKKNGVVEGMFGADGAQVLIENRDYYNQGAAIGVGPIASRPACTTTGFAWWATDEGNWNTTKAANTSGRLYRCVVPNWSLWYGSNNTFATGEPLTYPHPLVSGTTPSTFVPRHFIIRHRGP